MTEAPPEEARPTDPVGRVLDRVAVVLALFGGVLLALLVAMMVVSIIGRWLFSEPVPGDYEIVEMGTAIAVFAFLPLCHIRRGNVIVDIFLSAAPVRLQRACDALGNLLFLAIAAVLTWRMTVGGLDAFNDGNLTAIVQLAIWWAFPFAVFSLALLTLTCLHGLVLDLRRTLGR